MSFLSDGKRLIVLDQRYDHHYEFLQKQLDMDIAKLFFLCLVLGYKTGRKQENFIAGRKQFRPSYLSEDQRAVMYTIGEEICEHQLFKNFTDQSYITKIIKEFQLYSSGGMEILLEEVFSSQLTNNQLNPAYKNYDYDLLCYLYAELEVAPF